MKFTEQNIEQGVIASIEGRFDGFTSVEIQKNLLNILQSGKKFVVIDFKAVDYLSSAGMRTLLLISKRAKELGSIVCIINLSPQISDILEMTGFLAFLRTFPDLDAAVSAFHKG